MLFGINNVDVNIEYAEWFQPGFFSHLDYETFLAVLVGGQMQIVVHYNKEYFTGDPLKHLPKEKIVALTKSPFGHYVVFPNITIPKEFRYQQTGGKDGKTSR